MIEIEYSVLTFHPKFSKNVHNLDCPVVLPPHGPAIAQIESHLSETKHLHDETGTRQKLIKHLIQK